MPERTSKLDTGLIRELAAILREADLGEIEIEQGDMRVRVSRPGHGAPTMAFAPAVAAAAGPIALPAPAAGSAPAGPPPPAALGDHPGLVKSPMVGTVYLAPDPEAKPFIKVGDTVEEGATLLLVEAMKTYNPVPSPRAGVVRQILVATAQPVEYGEPLVIIE
jgi:acetyl-CoA carboxylase biotin carboxyl carrier protein